MLFKVAEPYIYELIKVASLKKIRNELFQRNMAISIHSNTLVELHHWRCV